MFNTVPSSVNLTDPIAEPFDYVINDPFFSYQNGTFIMTTALRVGVQFTHTQMLLTGYYCLRL